MNCDRHKVSLYSYNRGNINQFEKSVLSKHIEECEECSRELHEIKTIEAVFDCCREDIQLPADFSTSIMGSINLDKYKDAKKKRLKSLANIGLSMVAAGFMIFTLNLTAFKLDREIVEGSLVNAVNAVGSRLTNPVKSMNKSVSSLGDSLIKLNGISGRLERQYKGGM